MVEQDGRVFERIGDDKVKCSSPCWDSIAGVLRRVCVNGRLVCIAPGAPLIGEGGCAWSLTKIDEGRTCVMQRVAAAGNPPVPRKS